jgi:hypothetical protein
MRHLLWLMPTLLAGFTVPFVLSDLLVLPRDIYYLLYFVSVVMFAGYYARQTQLELRGFVRRRLVRAVAFGVVVGLLLMRGALAQPETPKLVGAFFWWALLWRGVVYGFVDGILLLSLP